MEGRADSACVLANGQMPAYRNDAGKRLSKETSERRFGSQAQSPVPWQGASWMVTASARRENPGERGIFKAEQPSGLRRAACCRFRKTRATGGSSTSDIGARTEFVKTPNKVYGPANRVALRTGRYVRVATREWSGRRNRVAPSPETLPAGVTPGGDQDHAIGAPGAIRGSGAGILEHIDPGDVLR